MTALAQDLWDARRLRRTISPMRPDLPKTLDEAYAVQEAIAALSGAPRRGYKVGSTSREAQRALGVGAPARSVLLAPFVHDSPARVALGPDQNAAVEGEFAFRIGRDLPPRADAVTMERIVAAIDGVAGAVEIVGSRFSGGLHGKGRLLTTADCGVNIALALGRWTEFTGQDLRAHRVTMTVSGAAVSAGTGDRALGDPLNVMLWLANHLSQRGVGLKAGEVVATGTCTGLDPVRRGDVATADFGAFGSVVVEVV